MCQQQFLIIEVDHFEFLCNGAGGGEYRIVVEGVDTDADPGIFAVDETFFFTAKQHDNAKNE